MRAEQITESRKMLRWSRSALAARAGMKPGAVAYIEKGMREPTAEEAAQLTRVFVEALGHVLMDGSDDAELVTLEYVIADVSVTRTYEWRGLERGAPCRITGERGLFHFMYHHIDERQEYAQVYGPMTSMRSHAKTRCVSPARLRTAKNKPLRKK